MSELDSPPKSFGPALSFAEKGGGGATRGSNSRGTKGGRWVGGRRWKSENETATSGRKDRRKWCDKGKKLMDGGERHKRMRAQGVAERVGEWNE